MFSQSCPALLVAGDFLEQYLNPRSSLDTTILTFSPLWFPKRLYLIGDTEKSFTNIQRRLDTELDGK